MILTNSIIRMRRKMADRMLANMHDVPAAEIV